MSVVNLLPDLYKLCEMTNQNRDKLIEIHRKMLCEPLQFFFPERSTEEIQFELLTNGLFDPDEGLEIDETVKFLEQQGVWQMLQREFEKLRSLWKGPDVPIYIYPLTKYRPMIDGIEAKKNGITYNGVLFLFVSTDLKEEELKALLAHEYHHICRLAYLNKRPEEIELIDSLIIEGMAEAAVEELYGEKRLSPWTKKYVIDDVRMLWEKYFVPALNLKGVQQHHPFLYGDECRGLPKWVGYSIGYRIVESYLKNGGPIPQCLFYQMPSTEIIQKSDFKI
ncbi:DUF2268 domain-containing protein [Ureibacillus sp. FSL E2-3493]|uniref:DUF2268 domain-containing protein n=1 Tax=Ureibacillus sp. FSL E2-3493 TaxID=2921367 RepID=UPI003119F4EC